MNTSVKTGILMREEGGLVRGFKKRWCVLTGNDLSFFKDENDEKTIATIHGEDITAVKAATNRKSKGDLVFYFDVSTKHGVECLSAESEEEGQQWIELLKNTMTQVQSKAQAGADVSHVIIESFVLKGIRITGKIQPHILAKFSGAKKHQDEKGWFCDKFISPSEVLNVMSESGWQLSSSYSSESSPPGETKLQPIHVFVFDK